MGCGRGPRTAPMNQKEPRMKLVICHLLLLCSAATGNTLHFSLPDTSGEVHTQKSFQGATAVVLLFIGTE